MLFNEELLNAELEVNHDYRAIDQTNCQVLSLFFSSLVGDSRDLVGHSEGSDWFLDAFPHGFDYCRLADWFGLSFLSMFLSCRFEKSS